MSPAARPDPYQGASAAGAQPPTAGSQPPATDSQPPVPGSQPPAPSSPVAVGSAQRRWLGDPRRCVTADCLLLLLGAATVAICVSGTHGVARLLLVLASACLIPGSALLTRLPVEDVLDAFGLAVGLGFCIEAVGALAMVWTGWWHPFGWGLLLVILAGVAFLLDIRRSILTARGSL